MKTLKITIACLLFTSAVFFVSCKKSNDNPATDSDVSGATDNALAENTSNDMVEIGAQAADNGSLSSYRLSNTDNVLSVCATVVRDSVAKTITVTFDSSVCMDGRVRSGSLVLDYSSSTNGATHYRDPGFSFTVATNNYTVDGNHINVVSKTVTNTTAVGFNPSVTDETWHITANLNIIKADGSTISWICDRVKTLLNTSTTYTNASTPIDWPNARVGITGNASGSRSNGETFTVNVTSQLIRDFGSCRVLKQSPFILGTLTYTPGTKYPRYVDYSAPNNGACDLQASVTIDGKTYLITLP